MAGEKNVLSLDLGGKQLRLVGMDKLHIMRYRWEEDRHSNAQWELHFVLQGACRVDLEAKSVRMSAGQALLIAPGQHHRPRTEPGAFERLSLAFFLEEGELSRQLRDRCGESLLLTAKEPMRQLAWELLREQAAQHPFRQLNMEAMVTRIVVELFRELELSENAGVEKQSGEDPVTEAIDSYFEQHFADTAGEAVLAERLHISRRQLVRVLHTHYGMSFREKLICTRMDYAAWLLRTTEETVSRICQRVGYSSEAAFFKIFRRHFGVTPSRYRTEKRLHKGE